MRQLVLISLLLAPTSFAANFNVSNLNDAGSGSLRQAVLDANGASGADTITFQAGLTGAIVLTTGQIDITESVTITGPGSAVLSVSGNDASRVFNIAGPAAAPELVSISGLTITDGLGYVSGDVDASAGGAIRVSGESVMLTDVRVTNSFAAGSGAGIAFSGLADFATGAQTTATLTIDDSEWINNQAHHFPVTEQKGTGGGVFARNGAVTISNSLFNLNGGPDGGGGIWATTMNASMPLRISGSTFDDNSSGSGIGLAIVIDTGGAIALTDVADAVIEDCEIFDNRSLNGGGAGVSVISSTLNVQRCTIAANQVQGGGSGGGMLIRQSSNVEIVNATISSNFAGGGGGIEIGQSTVLIDHSTIVQNFSNALSSGSSTTTVRNSILAESLGTNGDIQTGVASDLSIGYSLLQSAIMPYTDNGGNVTGQSPQLGPLANNGGATRTMLPALTSPVINAGDPAFAPPPSTDQRNAPRVQNGRTEMGAVEVAIPSADLSITKAVSANPTEGQTATFTIVVTNGGPGDAPDVVVTDVLPPNVTPISASTSQGDCSVTSTISCTLGTLTSGGSATVTINVLLTQRGFVTNTASVTSNATDPDGDDNSASITFAVAAPAGVAGVPALDPTMLLLLATSLAVAAIFVMAKR